MTGLTPSVVRSCDRKASDPPTFSPLNSKAPPQTDTSANQVIMSFLVEEPTATSTAEIHSTYITPVQQTNTPEDRHIGDKAYQNSTVTPHGFQCAACNDQLSPKNTWKAPCQHFYCVACLERLFWLSMEDETLYPPRCCQQIIPWSEVNRLVSWELVNDFEYKHEELDTQDRTYCSDPSCSTFIGAKHIAADTAVATCPDCEKLTFVKCESTLHAGECPSDLSVLATLEVARKTGGRDARNAGG